MGIDAEGKPVLWFIYRDDQPHPSDERVVSFARACLESYKRRTGRRPTILGLTSSFPAAAEERIIEEHDLTVVHNLPGWAKHEIWVGSEDE